MMLPFTQLLRRADIWLASLDRERDLAIRQIAREGRKPHLLAWLEGLEAERAKHQDLIAALDALRRANHPALLLPARPPLRAKA